jgi:hypothetical protein
MNGYQGARSGSELIAVTLASDRKAFRPCRRTCVSACARELAGEPGTLGVSLLGMTFLSKLTHFEVVAGALVLQQ